MHRNFAALAIAALLVVLETGPAMATDFRIETKVYVGNSKTADSQNTTLFRAGYVYDYLSGPDRVAVFDQRGGRFIVLDPQRKLKAEVKTDEVEQLVNRLQELAASSSNPIVQFAANPTFEVEFSEKGELTLTGEHVTYKLKTQPAANGVAAEQYHEFSDWYARFNTMAHPGSMPPLPRIRVNAELATRGLVPTEVEFNTRAFVARTEHVVAWRLLDSDHRRIAETANQLTTFEEVDFDELLTPASGR
jgi:hypothetical protein